MRHVAVVAFIVGLAACAPAQPEPDPRQPRAEPPRAQQTPAQPAPEKPVAPAPEKPRTPPGFVTREEFGERWPLTVDQGVLVCDNHAVTFTSGGRTYAVNGQASNQGYPEIQPIWRRNPSMPELRVNIAPLIQRGLELCR